MCNFTCSFFFALHYLLPLLLIVVMLGHLYLLHFRGRSSFRGGSVSTRLKIKFQELFLLKDAVNIVLL